MCVEPDSGTSLLPSPCAVRNEPDSETPFCLALVLFEESQTQLLSSAESLCRVECELDSAILLSLVVVHKRPGKLSKSLLSWWRRLDHPSTESLCCVHIVGELDSALSAES